MNVQFYAFLSLYLYNKVKHKNALLVSDLAPVSSACFILFPPASGIRPTVRVRKRGYHKMSDLEPETKQRVVVEFLTGEGIDPEHIHRRLTTVYGNDTVDIRDIRKWASKPGESELRLEGRLMQRAVIQFLTAEGERPLEISWRLSAVYRTVPYSRCSIWRWATRFHQGDLDLGDRVRQGRLPDRLRLLNATEPPIGFHQGDLDLGDRVRQGRLPDRLRLLNATEPPIGFHQDDLDLGNRERQGRLPDSIRLLNATATPSG